jgi:hypothetical protein
VNGLEVFIYFWDARDGQGLAGWWLAPKIGGDAVWAFNPSASSPMPPASGWKVPYDGPVDTTLVVSCQTQHGTKRAGQAHLAEEAKRRELQKRLEESKKAKVAEQMRLKEAQKKAEAEEVSERNQVAMVEQTAQLDDTSAELSTALDTAAALVGFAEDSADRLSRQRVACQDAWDEESVARKNAAYLRELQTAVEDARGVLAPLQGLIDNMIDEVAHELRQQASEQANGLRARFAGLDTRLDVADRVAAAS